MKRTGQGPAPRAPRPPRAKPAPKPTPRKMMGQATRPGGPVPRKVGQGVGPKPVQSNQAARAAVKRSLRTAKPTATKANPPTPMQTAKAGGLKPTATKANPQTPMQTARAGGLKPQVPGPKPKPTRSASAEARRRYRDARRQAREVSRRSRCR